MESHVLQSYIEITLFSTLPYFHNNHKSLVQETDLKPTRNLKT